MTRVIVLLGLWMSRAHAEPDGPQVPLALRIPSRRCPEGRVMGYPKLDALHIRHLHIRGWFNSGTNYIDGVLSSAGLPMPSLSVGSGYFMDAGGVKRWKHEPPSETLFVDPRELHLTIARHPISWMHSMSKRPYNFACGCELEEDARKPCLESGPPWHNGSLSWDAMLRGPCHLRHGIHRQRYDNLPSAWNAFYSGNSSRTAPSLMTRYEDFLVDPARMVTVIEMAVGCYAIRAPKVPNITKTYARYESEQGWRAHVAPFDVCRACALLDQRTLEAFNYTPCCVR